MSYKFAAFLSYSRKGQWPQWVEGKFLETFEHWLKEDVAPPNEVFIDSRIRAGRDWPIELKEKLACSKILVPLWSRSYFRSEWCVAELAFMVEREKKTGFGTNANSQRLIVPAIIHGQIEDFPAEAQRIQCPNLSSYANIRAPKEGSTGEKLEIQIKSWVPSIRESIEAAPPFDPAWTGLDPAKSSKLFLRPTETQTRVPLL